MATTCQRCNRSIPKAEPACVVDGSIWCRNCNDAEHPRCPGCGSELRVEAGQWIGCDSCRVTIRTRSRQNWYATTLVTDDQAAMIDFAVGLPSFRLSRSDFDSERKRLIAANGVASAADICWGILNRLQLAARNDAMRTELCQAKVGFLRKEGRDPADDIRELHRARVREALELGADCVQIVVGGCCEECAKQDGKRLSCKAALKKLPVPNPRCTRPSDHGGPFANCICMIVAEYDQE